METPAVKEFWSTAFVQLDEKSNPCDNSTYGIVIAPTVARGDELATVLLANGATIEIPANRLYHRSLGPARTGIEMCEVISRYLHEAHGKEFAPMDIWNASPDGSLWHVAQLYEQAQRYFDCKEYRPVDKR